MAQTQDLLPQCYLFVGAWIVSWKLWIDQTTSLQRG